MLRAHTTAAIPDLLGHAGTGEVLLSVPGICYRRDVIDRHHVGEPHQIDLWRIRPAGPALTGDDLQDDGRARRRLGAARRRVALRAGRPSLHGGRSRDLRPAPAPADREVEIGECGLAHPELLAAAGLAPGASGLAMGLGLDRLTMLAKGIDDIRLLRSDGPTGRGRRCSTSRRTGRCRRMPATRRDLSLVVAADLDAELLGDRVRAALGPDAASVEEVLVLARDRLRRPAGGRPVPHRHPARPEATCCCGW